MRASPIAVSFAAFIVGWAMPFVFLWLVVSLYSNAGVTDVPFLIFWPILIGTLAWALFGIPFIRRISPDSKLLQFPFSLVAGAIIASIAYWIIIGWALLELGLSYPVFAALWGAIAVATYGCLRNGTLPWVSRLSSAQLIALPIVVIIGVRLFGWPVIRFVSPQLACKIASSAERMTIMQQWSDSHPGQASEMMRWCWPEDYKRGIEAANG